MTDEAGGDNAEAGKLTATPARTTTAATTAGPSASLGTTASTTAGPATYVGTTASTTAATNAAAAATRTMREEWGRLMALLLAQFRRLDLVEDALAEAFEAATRTWPPEQPPDNPTGWVMTTARRRILDRLRAEAVHARTAPLLLVEATARSRPEATMADPGGLVGDDVLRLVLMCAHPALGPEAASALSLRLVLGVPTSDIARLFLVPDATMAARLTRAKRKIVGAGIPFALPRLYDLPARLDTVAQTAYLAFTAGYAAGPGPDLLRAELAGEAIRLVRTTLALRDEPVLAALLALMLLQHSRRDARVDAAGDLVLLPDQDRSRWRADEVAEAFEGLERLGRGDGRPLTESYRLQALIAAEHAVATTAAATRWDRIAAAYAALEAVNPSPVVRLARAVAVAELEGPAAGLALLDGLTDALPANHRLPAVRADLLERLGRSDAAVAAYEQAIALCGNEVERAHLLRRRNAVETGGPAVVQ